mmetsp:Transcript_1699/g.3972  ORF Transcript_1699/g.3972 Transcript_1699/m.3972 type:complete len:322 (-) Transcript_1699:463-1428(-)|eukprot:CAMPEP_0116085074 /NCGR_PEP_ID=MMETSP0327-20121206/4133_1 /TAXON_ID=44447 /ORGANISM="Pseudo-nitzschia delicatissima, Strain B596" /LENGTH=321 /DNA_ID=CAMNT_0003576045 /DNA_START=67 /DNA_END=1032 /DNA_ORIENTATION=-
MTADPEAAAETAAEISVSSSPLLSDEAFREPATIGEFLPNGKKRYRTWIERRNQEVKPSPVSKPSPNSNISDTVDICSGDGGSETDGFHNPLAETNDRIDEERAMMIEKLLRTTDVFPSKYLVDSDDDEEGGKSTKQKDGKFKKKSRKSALFQSMRVNSNDDEHQILASTVPPNASGIVSVLGRRIHVDRLVEGNANLYSMLRAWIQDDPQKTSCPPATARASAPRKTLADYKSSSSKHSSSHLNESKETILENPPPPRSVDLLGWLSTDPELRPYNPCYPTMEEMRDLHQKRRSKRAARILRKQRLASAKESLRRKGVIV